MAEEQAAVQKVFNSPELCEKILNATGAFYNRDGYELASVAAACVSRQLTEIAGTMLSEMAAEIPTSTQFRSFVQAKRDYDDDWFCTKNQQWDADSCTFVLHLTDDLGNFLVSTAAKLSVDYGGAVLPIHFTLSNHDEDKDAEDEDDEDEWVLTPDDLLGAIATVYLEQETPFGATRVACVSIAELTAAGKTLSAWVARQSKPPRDPESDDWFVVSNQRKLSSTYVASQTPHIERYTDEMLEEMMERGCSEGRYEKVEAIACLTVSAGEKSPCAILQLMQTRDGPPHSRPHPTLLKTSHLHEAFAGLQWH